MEVLNLGEAPARAQDSGTSAHRQVPRQLLSHCFLRSSQVGSPQSYEAPRVAALMRSNLPNGQKGKEVGSAR